MLVRAFTVLLLIDQVNGKHREHEGQSLPLGLFSLMQDREVWSVQGGKGKDCVLEPGGHTQLS